jgi:hypothetical protein
MTRTTSEDDQVSLLLSLQELDMITLSILNVRTFIGDEEFSTVMGYDKSELKPLLDRLLSIRSGPA